MKNPLISEIKSTLSLWISLILCAIHFFYFYLNCFILNQINFATYQFFAALFCAYAYFCSSKESTKEWHHYIISLIVTINVLSVVAKADLRAGAIYWSFVLPLLYYLFFSTHKGLAFTLIAFFPLAAILFFRNDFDDNVNYRALINFTLAYFTVWSICHLYEKQRVATNLALQKIALEDALTGIQNRHALKIFFESLKDEQDNIHILVIDIDYFKNVNDQFGHGVGDKILIEMTDLLSSRVGVENIYRLGGEEFLIILEETPDYQALYVAESLRSSVEQYKFTHEETTIDITVSIGVSKFQHGQAFNEFLHAADKNLYQAKNDGRNLVRRS